MKIKNKNNERLEELLMHYAYYGNLSIVRELVEKHNVNPRAKNDGALVQASKLNRRDVYDYLIEKGCDPASCNMSKIEDALTKKDLCLIEKVVHEINDPDFKVPAEKIFKTSDNNIINFFIDRDMISINNDKDSKTYYNFVLLECVKHNDFESIKRLVKMGCADIRHNDDMCLKWAYELGYQDIVEYLIEKGCDPKSCYGLRLKRYVYNGSLERIKDLVREGIDLSSYGINSLLASSAAHKIILYFYTEHSLRLDDHDIQTLIQRNKNAEKIIIDLAQMKLINLTGFHVYLLLQKTNDIDFAKYIMENGLYLKCEKQSLYNINKNQAINEYINSFMYDPSNGNISEFQLKIIKDELLKQFEYAGTMSLVHYVRRKGFPIFRKLGASTIIKHGDLRRFNLFCEQIDFSVEEKREFALEAAANNNFPIVRKIINEHKREDLKDIYPDLLVFALISKNNLTIKDLLKRETPITDKVLEAARNNGYDLEETKNKMAEFNPMIKHREERSNIIEEFKKLGDGSDILIEFENETDKEKLSIMFEACCHLGYLNSIEQIIENNLFDATREEFIKYMLVASSKDHFYVVDYIVETKLNGVYEHSDILLRQAIRRKNRDRVEFFILNGIKNLKDK